MWFDVANGRDLTAALHVYHPNIDYIRSILKQYEQDVPWEEVLDPSLNVPPYVVPADFNAFKDLVFFNWEKEDTLFNMVKKEISKKEWKEKIRQADIVFDVASLLLFLVHLYF